MNADRLSQTDKDEFKKDGSSTIYQKRMALQIRKKDIPPKPKFTRTSRKVPTIIDLTADNPDLIITMTDERQRCEDTIDYTSFPCIKLINAQPKYREVEATTENSPSNTYLSYKKNIKKTYPYPKKMNQ